MASGTAWREASEPQPPGEGRGRLQREELRGAQGALPPVWPARRWRSWRMKASYTSFTLGASRSRSRSEAQPGGVGVKRNFTKRSASTIAVENLSVVKWVNRS